MHIILLLIDHDITVLPPFSQYDNLPASPEGKGTDDVDSLVSDLRSMIDSSLLSDVTILAHKGSLVRAHSFILAARLPGFRHAISNSPISSRSPNMVIDMSEFSHESVLSYLEYLYTASTKASIVENVELKKTFEAISFR